jgi:hypothetical protein
MWKEPLRAMYVKYDISDYIDAGYTISRACLVQGAQTGGQAYMFAVDCPDNDLVMGDVYNTVPKHNTNNIAGSYDIGTVTSTYRNEVDMQLTCPGARKDNNAVFDISKYVSNKITSGEKSFTLMEFPRYAGGYVWLYNVPQLYIEFTKGSKPFFIFCRSIAKICFFKRSKGYKSDVEHQCRPPFEKNSIQPESRGLR